MRRSVFLDGVKGTFAKAYALLGPKNQDYGADADALRNFKMAQALGFDIPEAVMIRMCDKLSRAATLLKAEAGVKGETVEDTLLDLINYAAILIEVLKEDGTIETEDEEEEWSSDETGGAYIMHEVRCGPVMMKSRKTSKTIRGEIYNDGSTNGTEYDAGTDGF